MKSRNEKVNASLAADAGSGAANGITYAKERTNRLTTVAMLSTAAYVLTFLSHFIPINIMGFLHYDPSDIVTVVGGFLFGPLTALVISVVVSFVEFITISSTGVIGLIMNVISTFSFACVAAFVYKKKQTLTGAVFALAAGVVAMTAIMLLWNYIITPLYMANVSREQVTAMLLPVFLPFNLLKGTLNATVTLLLYKPLVTALRRAHLIAFRSAGAAAGSLGGAPQGKKHASGKAMMIPVAVVLLTCVMLLLAWSGII
ncbi:MAG: ECF transporter S component [Clostridiales Family XIII bacterium]|jgi:riboflavin transporter FmnP|nr:ECF transporter S component [Clostridiales Family XIII bacterium]